MACLNLSLAFLGKSKEIGGPWGMQSVHRPPMWPHVIHRLVIHCMRARCFAWLYLYMSRENISICEGVCVKVSHLSHLSRKKFVSCLCQSKFGKAVSCIFSHSICDRKNSETNHSSPHFSSQKGKHSRETKSSLGNSAISNWKKKYYNCRFSMKSRCAVYLVQVTYSGLILSIFFWWRLLQIKWKLYVVSYLHLKE